ncbi:hypothetical protein BOX15_Mlig001385g1, partial [Macrostomum lignano]
PTMDQGDLIKERTVAGLLARLKSYASLPWSNKPIEVSPLVCSRHGWLSREPDTLGCVDCGASLCVRLPLQTTENYGQQLMDMVTNLARAHSDSCPWLNDPMPDDTPLLPFTDPDADLRAFLNISESLAPISAAVNPNVRFTLQCTVARDLLEFVRSRSDCLLSLPDDVRQRCCLLAVAGWCPDTTTAAAAAARNRLICCCFCQRRVGLLSLNRGLEQQQLQAASSASTATTNTTVVVDDASLSDGVEAGMSLGAAAAAAAAVTASSCGGSSANMPAPSYALTEMIINRQLLFAKKQHSVSDWSLISNAGSEAASMRDLDDVQSVAGSTVSNLSAGEIANQLQDVEQQQKQQTPPPSVGLTLLNLPSSSSAGGDGSVSGDPDNWSTMTNADSDRRSVAQSDVATFSVCDGDFGSGGDIGGGSGGKRPRLDVLDEAGASSSMAPGAGSLAPIVSVDLLALHWAWCPWRPGDPSEDWCRSVLSHPDLPTKPGFSDAGSPAAGASAAGDRNGDNEGGDGSDQPLPTTPPTPTPQSSSA